MKVKQNNVVLFNIVKKGEYGLLNPLTKKLHRINETGRSIWEACEEPKSIDELVFLVAKQFHTSTETVQKDVEEFVHRMAEFELLEEV